MLDPGFENTLRIPSTHLLEKFPPLWNPKVHDRVHKSPLLDLISCNFNRIHTLTYLSKIALNITYHLRLYMSNDVFTLKFLANILYEFLISLLTCCKKHPSRCWFNYTSIIRRRVL